MKYKLTSVKLLEDLYKKFKYKSLVDEFTLQKLVNRSMDLYLIDNDFRNKINEWKNLKPSGSRL
tara:strand:+ start:18 stop:209 length:192 start_codon:yes stop_codon:yes gene_type:complete